MPDSEQGQTDLRFGRFRVLKTLGRGGMGQVYLAEDPVIGREVAIKVITADPALAQDELVELQARFEREFQSAGTLSHPNIVTVYDVGKEGDDTFIAMEFLPGESWGDILKSPHKLSYTEVADFAAKICSGLDHAHDKGIVHRDIKPANILVARNGEPKITDFGVAKLTSTNLTRTGMIIGTPSYMSPEQITGSPVSGASDQFSVAVILYQVLTRRLPFVGENPTTILYKIVHDPPPPPCTADSALPPEIDDVLLRALAKDPKERYGNCRELAASLRKALGVAAEAIDFDLDRTERIGGRKAALRKKRAKRKGRGLRTALVAASVVALAAGTYYYRDLWWPTVAETLGLSTIAITGGEGGAGDEGELETVSRDFTIIGETDGASIFLEGEDTTLVTPATLTLEGTIGEDVMLELQRDGQTVARQSIRLMHDMPTEWQAIEEVPPETFVVASDPRGAQVFLNDELVVGSTPTEIQLLVGDAYQLRVELPEYHSESKPFSFPDDLDTGIRQSRRFFFPLRPRIPPGRIVFESPYPVTVRVAGRSYGPSLAHDISLPPDTYDIVFSSSDVFLNETRQITVDSRAEIPLTMAPAIDLRISALPGNSRVFINEKYIDDTPFNRRLVLGSYEFRFEWPAPLNKTRTIFPRVTRETTEIFGTPE